MPSEKGRAAALKAWETIRRRKAEAQKTKDSSKKEFLFVNETVFRLNENLFKKTVSWQDVSELSSSLPREIKQEPPPPKIETFSKQKFLPFAVGDEVLYKSKRTIITRINDSSVQVRGQSSWIALHNIQEI